MVFIETPIFTEEIRRLFPDDEYRFLQWELTIRPEAGSIIKGSGGLRKIRWHLPQSGKRGGVRVIYYYDPPNFIYMLYPYRKSVQENLTPSQLKLIKRLIQEYLK
jgi:hypothetical protein